MSDDLAPLQSFEETVRTTRWTSLFPALEELCRASIGHKLFSCSIFRMDRAESGVAARIYTNDPKNYPLSGLKEIIPNRWTDRVISQRKIFVANSVDGFSDVFPDHDLIASLGLGSVVNLPLFLRGSFIGTVNMLDSAGYYSAARLAHIDRLLLPALLTFEMSPEAKA